MTFTVPESDIGGFEVPSTDVEGFIAPSSDTGEEDPFLKGEIAGIPYDVGGVLRLFEVAPEIATRVSRGESSVDALSGAFDYVAGLEGSAVDEESAKLAATFSQEQIEGHVLAAGLNAIAKLGGVPTGRSGQGVILGGLEIARQVLKASKATKVSTTSSAGLKAADEPSVVSEQLSLPIVGKQEELLLTQAKEVPKREAPTRFVGQDADELTAQLTKPPIDPLLPDVRRGARSTSQKVGDAKRKAWLASARKKGVLSSRVVAKAKIKDSMTLADDGSLILRGDKKTVIDMLKDLGVGKIIERDGAFVVKNALDVDRVLEKITHPLSGSYGAAPTVLEGARGVQTVKGRTPITLYQAPRTEAPIIRQTPEETAILQEAEVARLKSVDDNQLALFQTRQLPPEQLGLQLGEDADIFMRRGNSNASISEAGERIVNPEVDTLADVLGKVDDPTLVSRIGAGLGVVGGKSISPIREMGRYSPSLKKVADLMDSGETIRGFHHSVWRATGKFVPRLNDVIDKLKRRIRGVSKATNNSLASGLRGLKTAHPEEVGKIRGVLDSFQKYLREAGVEVGYVKNFFPRRYNIDYMQTKSGKKDFFLLLESRGRTPQEAERTYMRIIDGGGYHELPLKKGHWRNAGGTSAVVSSLKGRKLDIPEELLEPFLRSDNVHTALTDYIHQGIKVAEYTKSFGKNEEKLGALMKSAEIELGRQGKHLSDISKHVADVADSLVHAYRPLNPASPGGWLLGHVNRVATPLVHLISLPLVTLSSLSEPAMILSRASLRPTSILKAVPAVLDATVRTAIRTAFKGVNKADATRALEDVGLGLDSANLERLQGMTQGDFSPVSAFFFKGILLHDWTKLVMTAANETGKHMIKGHLKELSLANITAKRKVSLSKDLLSLGVSPEQGATWLRKGANEADEFYSTIIDGALRFTTDVVMVPRSTQLPLFHSNPHARLLVQLKSFPTMFGNTVVKNWITQVARGTPQQKLGVAATGITATIIGMFSNELQDYVRYGEKGSPYKRDWKPWHYAVAGADRTGMFALGSSGKDALTAHEFGVDPLTSVAGPFVAKVQTALEIPFKKDSDRALARMIAANLSVFSVNREMREDIAKTLERQLKRM